jgi:hypothetical protein
MTRTGSVFELIGILFAIATYAPAAALNDTKSEWVTVRTVAAIPADVFEALLSHFGHERHLADRGEPFEGTDLHGTGLPSRRLVLAGHSATEWFVAYEHGGRAHHLDIVILDRGPEGVRVALAVPSNAGRHDDSKGWQLDLSEILPVLSGPRCLEVGCQSVHY